MAEILNKDFLLDQKDKKRKKQFYKNWKTYAIGLGVIVIGTGTGLGVYFGVNANQTTSKTIADDDIVKAIDGKIYTVQTIQENNPESVTNQININFITNDLSDEIKKAFNQELFKFNNVIVDDHELNGDDLKQAGTIDAKINYDYGSIKSTETTLTIDIKENDGSLNNIFEYFHFKDDKNVSNFLNINDDEIIKEQVLNYLNESSLEAAGLSLENLTSNSVILKAADDSEKYHGQVTLTWKLKLFEIWGIDTDLVGEGIAEPNKQAELKGYFYLEQEQETYQIKYFDFYGYHTGRSNKVSKYDPLHIFTFINNSEETKEMIFDQYQQTNELEELFGSFELTDETTVNVFSTVYRNVRTYDLENKSWSDQLTEETEFKIDLSGKLTKN